MMNLVNDQVLSAISDGLAIISITCIVIRQILNYKFGIKFEEKFGIPREYYEFNFRGMLIETCEYILIFFSLFLMLYVLANGFLTPIKDGSLTIIINWSMFFLVLFFFTIAIVGILREIHTTKFKNNNWCCFLMIHVIPQIVVSYLCVKCKGFLTAIFIIMIVITVVCIIKYIRHYLYFDKNLYEIVRDGNEYYALFYFNKNYILIELIKKADNYFIREKGKYVIREIVNKSKTIRSTISD